MAPTIQTGAPPDKRQRTSTEKKSDLVCRVKYCNTLPDIPFDPKFITYPFESNRFVQYNPTSLERNYKHEMLTEHDLGVTIDLINPDTYTIDPNAVLDPADERLLEEEVGTSQDTKRSMRHAKSVAWLRRTEYISTELTRFQPSSDKTETKVGYNVKKIFKEETLYMDRDSQISAIDKTFDDAKKACEKHYSKPGVTPVEVLPIFPDFDMWKYPFAQVIFDTDPAPVGRPLPAQFEEMSQAMIRGVMDESGEQFVAYFLPTEDTMRKRKRDADDGVEYQDDEEYDYKMAREYNWNVKNKSSKGYEENYFFLFRENGVYYNELETRVRLNKRRLKQGQQPNNSRLVVRHRVLNELEFKSQEIRNMQLEPPQEEEEEEPAQEAAAEEDGKDSGSEKGDEEGEKDNDSGSEKGGSGSEKARSGSGSPSGSQRSRSASGSGSEKGDSGSEKGEDSGSEKGGDSGSEKGGDSGSEKGEDSESEKGGDSGSEKGGDSGSEKGGDSGSEKGGDSGSEKGGDSGSEKGGDSGSEKGGDSDSESGDEDEGKKSGSGSGSDSGSSSGEESEGEKDAKSSSGRSGSGSGSEDDERKKRDQEEIFGSASDSD